MKNFKPIYNKSAENVGRMVSQTNDVVKYEVKIGHATFTFIDTPGFGDTKGFKVDEEQAEKIR